MEGLTQSQTHDSNYFRLFNARNAKLIAVLAISLILVYHGLLRISYGEDTCLGLLHDGRYQGDHIWQPYGCMLHMYTPADSRMCMKYNRYWAKPNYVVFMGGRRMWDLYSSFLGLMSREKLPAPLPFSPRPPSSQDPSHSFSDPDLNLKVEFYWEPRVDTSMNTVISNLMSHRNPANFFILGAGLQSVIEAKGNPSAGVDFGFNVSLLLPYIHLVHKKATVLWMFEAPVDESKLDKNDTSLRNSILNNFNEQASSSLSYSPVKLWHSSRLLTLGYHLDSSDGIQIGPVALNYNTQILANLYCNDLLNFSDGTCCSRPEPMTSVQMAVFLFLGLCFVVTVLMGFSRCRFGKIKIIDEDSSLSPPVSQPSTFFSLLLLSKFSVLIVFFYACDRGNIFMKENKWFTHFNFFLPTVYLTVLGIFFTEETKKTNFMHKDQTDEWKGWMQLVILCFHMTGADKVLWISMIVRCLFSGYLFLLGYGHFQYFWTTGDFSLKRVFRVLLRYNLLVVFLSVTMNRPYQFYQYVPVASYWFLFCYVTLAIPPHVTAQSTQTNPLHYFVMVVKLVLFFTVVSILYLSEVFFEKVFLTKPWKALFVTPDDSIQSWWFRWWIDRYSAGGGMVLAFVTNVMRRHLILNDSQPLNLFSKPLSSLVAFVSITGISAYALVVSQCRAKSDCNEIHGYLAFLPVMSYLFLRNVFGLFRGRVSTFFAWFGRISLEMFVAQTHVWLAADTHGVLVLFPRWPVFNVIITSFIFICISHEIRLLTLQLIPILTLQLVPDNQPNIILRNIAILLIVCVPLGFLYGLF